MTTTKEPEWWTKPRPVDLYLMPVPAETFDAAAALKWLQDDARSWVTLIGEALSSPDAKTRAAFAVLALDVEHCLEAAGKALAGESVSIVEESFDPKRAIPDLARMVSMRPQDDGDAGENFDYAMALLRAELLRYLDAEDGGGTEEEDAD